MSIRARLVVAGKAAPGGLVAAALFFAAGPGSPILAQEPNAAPTFTDVAPILNERCSACHSGEFAPNELRLTSFAELGAGSSTGPVAHPGDPAGSKLVRRIKGIDEPRMPLDGPPYLDEAEIALIEAWVAAGMPEGDIAAAAAPGRRERPGAGEPVTYSDIQPIIQQRCVKCHTADGLRGPPPEGLQLKTRDLLLAGGDRMVVVPGNPGASDLVRRIRGQSLPRMPLDGPPFLDDDEIRLITDWIAQGAPDDNGNKAPVPAHARVRIEGTLTAQWSLDGTPLTVTPSTRIDDDPAVGDRVEVRGRVAADGSITATRIRSR